MPGLTEHPGPTATFVGRQSLLRQLSSAFAEAEDGRGAVVLVTGEAGIGKTRLCDEFANTARSRGATVIWATCREGEGAPAYWPWIQVLRALTDPPGVETVDAHRLPPNVAALLAGRPVDEAGGDPEQARFRLFDALARVLLERAPRPLVIVLDDLHWADTSSLLALRFLAAELPGSHLLVVGTFRDLEVPPGHRLAEVVAQLGGVARRIPLPGLDRDETAAFITLVTGVEPDDELVHSVLAGTGGNPFFAGELLRLVSAQGSLDALARGARFAVPPGVREVVVRHLGHLPPPVRPVLEAAAVLGQEFDVELVARTARVPAPEVRASLEAASEARLVTPAPRTGRYGFVHALVREVLYLGLGADRRADLHLRAGEALEDLRAGDAAAPLGEIAVHLVEAAPASDPAKAVRYCSEAGRRAMDLLAWEEAAGHFQRALDLFDRAAGAGDHGSRRDLHLALGEAQARGGETELARANFVAAGRLARDLDDAAGLARAALGLGMASPVWGVDPALVELLREALHHLGDTDPGLAAEVLARLAQAEYFSASDGERRDTSDRAVAMARMSGESQPLAAALVAQRALWGPDDLLGRAAVVEELFTLARRTRNQDLEVQARAWRLVDRVAMGDLAAADRELVAHAALADRLHQPLHLRDVVLWRAMRALLDGRFADTEDLADQALTLGRRAGDPGARSIFGVQRAMILAEQGDAERLAETLPLVREIADAHPEIPAWRALLAFSGARAGRYEEARLDLEAVGAGGFASVRRDETYLVALTHSADTAAILGHTQIATTLLPLLEPFADHVVVIDRGLACKGSTQRLLGLLHGVVGDLDGAVRRLELALDTHERMGARAFAIRNRAELAEVLRRRSDRYDADRAALLAGEASRAAQALGAPGLVAAIAEPGRVAPAGDPGWASGDVFRREGETWTLCFGHRTVRLRDSKGLRDIAGLLALPEREVHALDLYAGLGTHVPTPTSGDELLDARARRAYEDRIVELEEEIAEAAARNDSERAALAQEEMDFLVQELAAAVGLGGRGRRATDEAERARKAVTWRIRDAMKRIERVHPELGRHLRSAVRTGTFCSYRPERPVTWRL